ncbi:uncharacterized protein LOC114295060 isoform X2 [Camellia sinensis]|uniref:uncharacterized protein LOC114295060 isoform X2 n=1 Tax=Camellia sinensis TaxID=4442 RepID=UPI0010363678|nr:uncharacterized protein LOC114295060 isoform X2 [Camellia sinensis]
MGVLLGNGVNLVAAAAASSCCSILFSLAMGNRSMNWQELENAWNGGSGAELLVFLVELQEGSLDQFTHEMEPFLYKQGMPVRLNKGFKSSPIQTIYRLIFQMMVHGNCFISSCSISQCWKAKSMFDLAALVSVNCMLL